MNTDDGEKQRLWNHRWTQMKADEGEGKGNDNGKANRKGNGRRA